MDVEREEEGDKVGSTGKNLPRVKDCICHWKNSTEAEQATRPMGLT